MEDWGLYLYGQLVMVGERVTVAIVMVMLLVPTQYPLGLSVKITSFHGMQNCVLQLFLQRTAVALELRNRL